MRPGRHNPFQLIKRALLPAIGLLIIANFVGYAVAGPNGVLSWSDYRRMKLERQVKLAHLREEQNALSHRAKLLDPAKADPDLADEMVRSELGLVRPDEVVIPLKD